MRVPTIFRLSSGHSFISSVCAGIALGLVALTALHPAPAVAQSGTDPISGLRRVYGGILLFKQFRSACDQLAPENAALHKAAYDTFAQKHSVARIEQFFAAAPNPVPKLDGVKSGIEKVAPKILAQVVARPDTCAVLGPLYEQMVANQMGAQGVTNLGTYFDSLLTQANLVPPASSLVPDATTQAPAVTAPQPQPQPQAQANRAAPAAGKSTKGKIESLTDVYEAAFTLPRFQKICDEIVPGQAALHKAAIDTFSEKHSFARIQAYFATSRDKFPWIDATDQKIETALGKVRTAFRKKPQVCGALPLILKNLVETKGGATDLGAVFDGLVSGAKSGAPAALPSSDDQSSAPQAVQPETKVVALTATGALPMPTPIRDRVKQLPGLSWNVPDTVRSESSRCVWRCAVYAVKKGASKYPRLVIHEAVPLPADQALETVLASVKGKEEITRKIPLPVDKFGASMPMRPDRTVAVNVFLTDPKASYAKHSRRVLFAFEKDGLSVVAEWYYLKQPPPEKAKPNEFILGAMMRSIRMDRAVVEASLRAPLPVSVDLMDGAPPAAGQVIYAETPKFHHNTVTLSGYYDDDARYLDKSAYKRHGAAFKLKGSTTYYYVPPMPAGTTIEGVFKSSSGYAGIGITVLKTKKLVFGSNGRYSTKSGSGVNAGLVSTGSKSASEGSYRISGYAIDLIPDGGQPERMAFFPYYSTVFWPGSKKPTGAFGLINIGGKVMYRDDD